jgi:uncharacterized protein YbaR (Trm112 family)
MLCAFCGLQVDLSEAVEMHIHTLEEPEEGQTLVCHASCLVHRLDSGVPILPSIEDAAKS